MTKSYVYGRTLLNIDDPTRTQTKRVMDHFFKHQSGLILPKDREGYCGGCTREFARVDSEKYFGEKFCVDCVEKWKAGAK